MSLLHIIGLIVVAILVSFLCRRHEARLCRRMDERTWIGRGMDVTPVSRRIQDVREDYLAVVSARPGDRHRRRRLHAVARCALKERAYFRHARTEAEDAPPHDATAHPG
jgi:hypothetical protein